VILQSHGGARNDALLLDQLTYVDAACNPTCADLQFAVHLALQ
jgi:hypothetical protein